MPFGWPANRLPRVTLATLRSSIVVIWRLADADCERMRAVAFVSAIFSSSAQEAATDVACVEAVIGRVVAFAAHRAPAPFLVDTLDVISDRTRFDLLANSELRLCHIMRRFLTMRGPAQISVSAEAIAVKAGKPVDISEETCTVEPSSFQGGFPERGATTRPY